MCHSSRHRMFIVYRMTTASLRLLNVVIHMCVRQIWHTTKENQISCYYFDCVRACVPGVCEHSEWNIRITNENESVCACGRLQFREIRMGGGSYQSNVLFVCVWRTDIHIGNRNNRYWRIRANGDRRNFLISNFLWSICRSCSPYHTHTHKYADSVSLMVMP